MVLALDRRPGFRRVFVELHHYAIRLSNDGFFLSIRTSSFRVVAIAEPSG
jgi:hypothetical protein